MLAEESSNHARPLPPGEEGDPAVPGGGSVRDAQDAEGVSIFEKLIRLVEETGPLKVNFKDLSGLSVDLPELRLEREHIIHVCNFCSFAKGRPETLKDCVQNKLVTDMLAMRRKRSFCGQCHVGVTDIVYPLVIEDRVLGVFYCGSVALAGTERKARSRIMAYCRRKDLDPEPFLDEFARLPVVSPEQIDACYRRLETLTDFVRSLIEARGLPVDCFTPELVEHVNFLRNRMPPVVRAAFWHVSTHYRERNNVKEIATLLGCHPDYLSRTFKKTVGWNFSEYVSFVKVFRACWLLKIDRFDVADVAFQLGFEDQSHFGRVFKRIVGMTPGRFRREKPNFSHLQRKAIADVPFIPFILLRDP